MNNKLPPVPCLTMAMAAQLGRCIAALPADRRVAMLEEAVTAIVAHAEAAALVLVVPARNAEAEALAHVKAVGRA